MQVETIMQFLNKNKYLILILFLLSLSVLSGVLQKGLTFAMSSILHYDQIYIAKIYDISKESFLELGAALSVLSVLKGSSIGFSFIFDMDIQYGNAISSVVMLVEKAWEISLASLITIEFIKLLLEYCSWLILSSITLFTLFYLVEKIIPSLFLKNLAGKTKYMFLRFVIIFMIFPLYIALMSVISNCLNMPIKSEIRNKTHDLHLYLPIKKTESIKEISKNYHDNLKSSHDHAKSKLQIISGDIIRYMMLEIFSIIIVPALFIVFTILVFRINLLQKNYTE